MASSATARKLVATLSLLTAAPAVSFMSSTRTIRSFSSRSGGGGTFRSSTVRASPGMLLDGLLGGRKYDPPCVMGEEEIMSQKEHGTSKGAYRGFSVWCLLRDAVVAGGMSANATAQLLPPTTTAH